MQRDIRMTLNTTVDKIYCRILNSETKQLDFKLIEDTPHYKFLNDDKDEYINYIQNAKQYEHSPEVYNQLYNQFDYDNYPPIIVVKHPNQNIYVVYDGVHRLAILKKSNYQKVKVIFLT